jgi:glycolate oxidase iron-sulfur subunit
MPAAMLDATARPPVRNAAWSATGNGERGTATLLTGCVMEGLLAPVNRATERTLTVNGYRVVATPGQVCCGALHAHAGDATTARELAKANIAAFEASGTDFIAHNSAGCGAMCKEYGHLLADDKPWAKRAAAFSERVRDVHTLLAAAGPVSTPAIGAFTQVAWDAPCHLEHAQRVVTPPLVVLSAIGTLVLRPLVDSDQCCGSAGIFNLTQPDVAARVLRPKLERIAESGATVLATANPGCLMQIGGGLRLAGSQVVTRHPVELLDEAYAASSSTR